MTISVPIISLAGINDPEGRKEIAKAVRAAARNSGFMQIVDHGISEELVAEAFDVSKRVFALPLEEKVSPFLPSLLLELISLSPRRSSTPATPTPTGGGTLSVDKR